MKQGRDLHKQVRVVYRACRKLYGKESTQDECLKVFKVVFPELYRFRNTDDERVSFSEVTKVRIKQVVSDWKPSGSGWLKKLTDYILCYICNHKDIAREDAITFCEDILPVVMRIRKLTPRECFRLMGVPEEDIDKILNSGISNSACYKLAGNSIVVDVMTAIFDKLFVNTEQEKACGVQLSLF